MTVRSDTCLTSHGVTVNPYYVVETSNWAQVFALDSSGRVLVVRQYRHGAEMITTEMPSGRIDKGEDPMLAAQRELREETGYVSANWQPLSIMRANPARQPTQAFGFLAQDVEYAGEPNLDPAEQIETDFVEMQELFELATNGQMPAPHVACILDAFIALGRISPTT